MEFIVSRNRLLRALQHTRCAITKGELDVFKYFVLTFPDNPDDCTMTVHASNGGLWITETVLLDKLIPGTDDGTMHPVAIWYSDLLRCIKALDEQPLHFTVFEYQLSVQHSVGSFRLPLGNQAMEFLEFPHQLPDVEAPDCYTFEYEAPGLRSILNRCRFAMAEDELRPVMNGVYMNLTDTYADYVSSDGHKLVRVRKSPVCCCDTATPANLSLILPSPIVKALMHILPTTGDVVFEFQKELMKEKTTIDATGHRQKIMEQVRRPVARIIIDDLITLSFNPIDGRYPQYWSVIPEHSYFQMTIDRKQLIKSFDRLVLFSSVSDLIKLTFSPERLRLNAKDTDFSMDAEEMLPCTCAKTDGTSLIPDQNFMQIGMKGRTMIQTLRALQSEKVVFHLIDSSRAIIIHPVPQPDVEDITMLLMPMLCNDNDD